MNTVSKEPGVDTRGDRDLKLDEQPPLQQLPAVHDKHQDIAERKARKPAATAIGRNIATALAAITAEVGIVSKKGYNKFHGYKYAAMGDVLEKLTPLIGKHGIIIMQTEVPDGRKMLDDGRAVAVEYEFTIAHSSGEIWPDRPRQTGLCRARDSKGGFDDKCFNKTHTAARKYFLLSLFQVATGEEDDADTENGTIRRPAPPAKNVMREPAYDRNTGEIYPESVPATATTLAGPEGAAHEPSALPPKRVAEPGAALTFKDLDMTAREAAAMGAEAFNAFWRNLSGEQQEQVGQIGADLRRLLNAAEERKRGRGETT